MSRNISSKYLVWLGSIVPPPPKHPQSMDKPRAHADSLDSGIKAVRRLVEQLALGVREGRG